MSSRPNTTVGAVLLFIFGGSLLAITLFLTMIQGRVAPGAQATLSTTAWVSGLLGAALIAASLFWRRKDPGTLPPP